MAAMMVGLIVVIAARLSRADWDRFIPKFAVSAIFIWHFIGLGLLSLIALALIPILLGQKIVRVTRAAPIKVERSAQPSDWNRREFLRFAGFHIQPHRNRDGSAQQHSRPAFRFADRGAAEGIGRDHHRAGQRHACWTIH
jgi:hypothetical protein